MKPASRVPTTDLAGYERVHGVGSRKTNGLDGTITINRGLHNNRQDVLWLLVRHYPAGLNG